MTTEDFQYLLSTYRSDPQFWGLPRNSDGTHRVVVLVPDDHDMVRNNIVVADEQFTIDFMAAMSAAGLFRGYMDKIYSRGRLKWEPLDRENMARQWLQRHCIFVLTRHATDPPQSWDIWTRNGPETPYGFFRDAQGSDEVRRVLRSPPAGLARAISDGGTWDDVVEAKGLLRHPYYTPDGFEDPDWMQCYPVIRLPHEAPDYKHLKTLFSGFDLPPVPHTAVYTFLLASFHASSLNHARPVLIVDSWKRARGKSQLSSAIKYLVDEREGVKSMSRGRDKIGDESIATLRENRCEVLDNIDKRAEFGHEPATTGSTGVIEARGKYERNTSDFPGKLFLMNCVVGACSLDSDLSSRILRVEIPGESEALKPQPHSYAKRYRDKILKEIIAAHHFAPEIVRPPSSRMQEFMQAGLTAYCHVFGADHDEARANLDAALRSGAIYKPRVLGSLMMEHPDLLQSPYYPAGGISDDRAQLKITIPLLDEDLGATAFGLTVTKKGDSYVWE